MNLPRTAPFLGVCLLVVACSHAVPSGPSTAPSRRPDLTSNLQVEPGKEFLFGGGANGAYIIDARNSGTVTVEISAESPDGTRTPVATLKPGETALHNFTDGQIAIVKNTSSTRLANSILRVWGETRVGMRYRDAGGSTR